MSRHAKSNPLDYERQSDADRRLLHLMKPERSGFWTILMLAAILISGLFSCAFAGAFWVMLLKVAGG